MDVIDNCALVIVGAGYAGVCALNTAVKYLKQGDRVAIVDRGRKWGGQWVDQYDFVRLHQPFPIFTAGERAWAIEGTKPQHHLASKNEILTHFQDIVAAALEESGVELIPLFGHSYTGHTIENGRVRLTAEREPTLERKGGLPTSPSVTVTADRLIKASGFDIKMKQPLPCATTRVVSLTPADVLKPTWNAAMRTVWRDKPIYIIGSGKTAMDCVYHLSKGDLSGIYRDRLFCISGRGMLFANREMLFPKDWFAKNVYGNWSVIDYFLEMLEMYDGTNAHQVLEHMHAKGFFISAIPGAEAWSLGIASVEEVEAIRGVLVPVEEKVIRAHLLAVEDDPSDEGRALLKIRAVADGSVSYHAVPAGAVIVNCTESLGRAEQNEYEPILSDDGLVLAPQTACGFTGPSAHMLTHAWYLGKLEKVWRRLIRVSLEVPRDKYKLGLHALYPLIFNVVTLREALPLNTLLYDRSNAANLFPMHRRLVHMLKLKMAIDRLRPKHEVFMDLRFSDPQPADKLQAYGTSNEALVAGEAAATAGDAGARARL